MKSIDEVYNLVRDEVKPIIKPMINNATRWNRLVHKYAKAMDACPLDSEHLKEYKCYYNLLKEAQTQLTAITKVLLSAVRRDAAESVDEFEQYLKENGMA